VKASGPEAGRALNKVRWARDGRHIAAGDSAGALVLFDVAHDVRRKKTKRKQLKKVDADKSCGTDGSAPCG
jgi:hypothetical protein